MGNWSSPPSVKIGLPVRASNGCPVNSLWSMPSPPTIPPINLKLLYASRPYVTKSFYNRDSTLAGVVPFSCFTLFARPQTRLTAMPGGFTSIEGLPVGGLLDPILARIRLVLPSSLSMEPCSPYWFWTMSYIFRLCLSWSSLVCLSPSARFYTCRCSFKLAISNNLRKGNCSNSSPENGTHNLLRTA